MCPEVKVGVDGQGRICAVLKQGVEPPGQAPRTHLKGCALLPGFANAHSHAFQRVFRAQTEYLRAGRESEDFWSWRQMMYAAAGRMTPERVYDVALDLYKEMLAAGYTSVGEFHYLHHGIDGRPCVPPLAMAEAVVEAGLDAGIRMVLLMTLYHSGGIGQPATSGQRRFTFETVEAYLQHVEAALERFDDPRVSVGMAPHSIRAVPLEWLSSLALFNRGLSMPIHMHLCEQEAEVEASIKAFGVGPIEALEGTGLLGPSLVAVHATHLQVDDPKRLADVGAAVCACPTTEANLGDGFLPALELLGSGVSLCIGSDSHASVNPFEELRMIEHHERLRRRRRGVLATVFPPSPDAPDKRRVAPGLLSVGTLEGARALKIDAGMIREGSWADLIALRLDDPALSGVPPHCLPEALVFSAGPRCVEGSWVAGQRRFGTPPSEDQ
jgi:formimidoylglutamate deiminase